jgi:hypothetical protein
MWECLDAGGEWLNPLANFDNVPNSLLTLFTAVTTEGWVGIMWQGVDATSLHLVPVVNYSVVQTLYFISFMVGGSLFILNLFVGVVIGNFIAEKTKLERNDLLTLLQIEFCDTMAKCYITKPIRKYKSQGNIFKDKLYYMATSKKFENFIFGCIVLNTIGMSCTWLGEPAMLGTVTDWINLTFAVIYTIECIIKVGVLGKMYF